METINAVEMLVSLSSNREALLESLILYTLLDNPTKEKPAVPDMPITVETSSVAPAPVETGGKLKTPFDMTAVFQVGAQFRKRKAIKGREHVVVTVMAVDGINVYFDKSFRCKAVEGSAMRKTLDSKAAREFLEEFERI